VAVFPKVALYKNKKN